MGILLGNVTIPNGAKISPECKDLLGKCLQKDAGCRIDIKGIRNHKWFKDSSHTLKKHHPPGYQIVNYDDGEYEGIFINGMRHGRIDFSRLTLKAKEFIDTKTETSMMASGSTTRLLEEEASLPMMEMSTKENL